MYCPESTTITVRHFGMCGTHGEVPRTAVELIAALQSALSDVPPEYRNAVEVDLSEDPDPYENMGYEALRVTYDRPMTGAEIAEYVLEWRSELESEMADYQRLANDRAAELAALVGLSK